MYYKIKRQATLKNKYLIGVFIILVLADSLQSKANIMTVKLIILNALGFLY